MNTEERKRLEFLRSVLPSAQLGRDGKNVDILCPECPKRDGKKKLSISLSNFGFQCWRCGYSGRLSSLLGKHGPPGSKALFEEKFFGIIVPKKAHEPEDIEEKLELPSGFTLLGPYADGASTERAFDAYAGQALAYLARGRKRPVTRDEIWRYRLGITGSGKFARRIVFPSFDSDGALNFFQGRAWDRDARKRYESPSVERTRVIVNDVDVDWSARELVLVEGPFDLISCSRVNATCLLGSTLDSEHALVEKIIARGIRPIVMLDGGERKKTMQVASVLAAAGCDVSVVSLPNNTDPGDTDSAEIERAVSNARPWDRLSWKIEGLTC